jgi:hypothetical protein
MCFIFYEIIVKVWPQIYVIYFLSRFKLKKITLIIFTFSGIYTGFAQNRAEVPGADSLQQTAPVTGGHDKQGIAAAATRSSMRIYPNPAKNKIEIEIRGFEPGYVQVMLTDVQGKTVRDEKRLVINGNEMIVFMFSEKPGLYVVMLKQGAIKLKSKLLIR